MSWPRIQIPTPFVTTFSPYDPIDNDRHILDSGYHDCRIWKKLSVLLQENLNPTEIPFASYSVRFLWRESLLANN